MNEYGLLKLLQVTEVIHARKRLQKLVFLLESAGFDFRADFFLHLYGPYSRDVADATDELVRAGLVHEEQGREYSYRLTDKGQATIENCEKSADLQGLTASFIESTGDLRFRSLAGQLGTVELKSLETTATLLYYMRLERKGYDDAKRATMELKHVNASSPRWRKIDEILGALGEPKTNVAKDHP